MFWLVVLAVIGLVIGIIYAKPFGGSNSSSTAVTDNEYPISYQTVLKEPIQSQTQVDATLGYAGSYTVINQAQGTVTELPTVGQVIKEGQVLYQVDGSPVVLLYGDVPAYRSLSLSTTSTATTGADVQELNADLVLLGYATSSEIDPYSDEFTWWTKYALEKLQSHLGESDSGVLALGQAVFLPTALLVSNDASTLGGPAQPGGQIITGSSDTPQVSIALDASQQGELKVGDSVSVTLPDNQNIAGVVSSVGTIATTPSDNGQGGSSPTIPVTVNLTDPSEAGGLDQAPVEVTITLESVPSAYVVPVDALLALGSGGYAIEEVSSKGVHSYVPVSLGIFDDADSLVQVSGPGLAEGQRIVVPNV